MTTRTARHGPAPSRCTWTSSRGPFDLLLALISKHKLDVTEVALSQVTDEFIAHIRAMGPDWDLDQATDFLVVAATLLDLKAARLLPVGRGRGRGGPRPAGGAGPAVRPAAAVPRLQAGRGHLRRPDDRGGPPVPAHGAGWSPSSPTCCPRWCSASGPASSRGSPRRRCTPKPPPQVYVDHIHAPLVSVQEQAAIVVGGCGSSARASFRRADRRRDGTLDVVARSSPCSSCTARRRCLRPGRPAGRAAVRWTGGERGRQPAGTDEFVTEPTEERRTTDDRRETSSRTAGPERGSLARSGRALEADPAGRRRAGRRGAARPGAGAARGARSRPRCASWPTSTPRQGRGFDLRQVAGGWRFYTRAGVRAARRALRPGRPAGPAHPGRAGDAGRGGLPPAGQPGPGLGGARRQLRRRDAHAGHCAA